MGIQTRRPKVDIIAKMNALELNPPWYRALAAAIIVRARYDWETLNKTGEENHLDNSGWCGRYEVDKFFESGWCDALLVGTGYNAEMIKELGHHGKYN